MTELIVPRNEIRRYLGWKGQTEDPALEALTDRALTALRNNAEPKQISRLFPLHWTGPEAMSVEGIELKSHALALNLRDCGEVYLFAATLGFGPDRLIARAQATGELAYAMALQAAGAAMIEVWCDAVNEDLCAREAARGHTLRPRFSPGYGDLPLEHQREVFRLLGVQKHIGVTLTDSLLMVPTKSVTAFIGVSDRPRAVGGGCTRCGRTDCAYRREEDKT